MGTGAGGDVVNGAHYGVEVGAVYRGPEGPTLINVGEVGGCASRAEAEHLGRLLIGRTLAELSTVAGFDSAAGDVSGVTGQTVSSFSVYYYDGDETTQSWEYDGAGKAVTA